MQQFFFEDAGSSQKVEDQHQRRTDDISTGEGQRSAVPCAAPTEQAHDGAREELRGGTGPLLIG